MKTILKFGIISAIIYGAVLLILTLYARRLMPAELDNIVPLWLPVKSYVVKMTAGRLSSLAFLLIIAATQAIAAFFQGAIIGALVFFIRRSKDRI